MIKKVKVTNSIKFVTFILSYFQIGQVLNTVWSNNNSSSSSTFSATSGTLAITPTATNSKVLVIVSLGSFQNGGRLKRAMMNIVRNSTNVIVGDDRTGIECTACVCVRAADDNYAQIPLAFTALDSPATTSAVTYKVQATRGSDSQTVYLNGNQGGDAYSGNTASTITVMEVSA